MREYANLSLGCSHFEAGSDQERSSLISEHSKLEKERQSVVYLDYSMRRPQDPEKFAQTEADKLRAAVDALDKSSQSRTKLVIPLPITSLESPVEARQGDLQAYKTNTFLRELTLRLED